MTRSTIWIILCATLLSWFVFFGLVGFPQQGIDDANIFKVYAQNLAHGEGFVYQVGEERVEGFTSLLYTVILGLVSWTFHTLDTPALILNLGVLVGIVITSFFLLNSLISSDHQQISVAHVLLTLWLLTSPFFMIWVGITQMDVGLFTLLILLSLLWGWWVLVKGINWWRCLGGVGLIGLLLLVRPEGAAVALILVLWTVWLLGRNRANTKRHNWMFVSLLVTSWFGFLIALTSFRLCYFGWPLPNTFYAKVSPDLLYRLGQGISYLATFFWQQPLAFVALLVTVFLPLLVGNSLNARRNRPILLLISLITFALIFIPVWMGGDHFAGWRFFQPAWPLIGIGALVWLIDRWSVFAQSIKVFIQKPNWGVIVLGGLIIAQSSWSVFTHTYHSVKSLAGEFVIADDGLQTGRLLNQWFPQTTDQPRVGVITAGGIAFTYQGRIFDMLGLNNTEVAHDGGQRKGLKNHASLNPDLVVKESPELLVPRKVTYQYLLNLQQLNWSQGPNTQFVPILLENQKLHDTYTEAWIARGSLTPIGIHPMTIGVVGLFRNDFLTRLASESGWLVEKLPVQ